MPAGLFKLRVDVHPTRRLVHLIRNLNLEVPYRTSDGVRVGVRQDAANGGMELRITQTVRLLPKQLDGRRNDLVFARHRSLRLFWSLTSDFSRGGYGALDAPPTAANLC